MPARLARCPGTQTHDRRYTSTLRCICQAVFHCVLHCSVGRCTLLSMNSLPKRPLPAGSVLVQKCCQQLRPGTLSWTLEVCHCSLPGDTLTAFKISIHRRHVSVVQRGCAECVHQPIQTRTHPQLASMTLWRPSISLQAGKVLIARLTAYDHKFHHIQHTPPHVGRSLRLVAHFRLSPLGICLPVAEILRPMVMSLCLALQAVLPMKAWSLVPGPFLAEWLQHLGPQRLAAVRPNVKLLQTFRHCNNIAAPLSSEAGHITTLHLRHTERRWPP